MKREDLLLGMGGIREDYIAEAMPRRFRQRKRHPYRWLAIAACFALIFCVGSGVAWRVSQPVFPVPSGTLGVKYVPGSDGEDDMHIDAVDGSEIASRFVGISYASRYYVSYGRTVEETAVSRIRETIEVREGDVSSALLEVAELTGVNASDILAVRQAGYPGGRWTLYFLAGYVPDTIDDWRRDWGLTKDVRVLSVLYAYSDADGKDKVAEYVGVDAGAVWDALLGNGEARMTAARAEAKNFCLTVTLSVPSLGGQTIRFCVARDGSVQVDLPGSSLCYRIGRRAACRLAEEILATGKGYELIREQSGDAVNR